jgi:hypothetical protein
LQGTAKPAGCRPSSTALRLSLPPGLADHHLVATAAGRAHGQRLQHALVADRDGQFLHEVRVDAAARLVGPGVEQVDADQSAIAESGGLRAPEGLHGVAAVQADIGDRAVALVGEAVLDQQLQRLGKVAAVAVQGFGQRGDRGPFEALAFERLQHRHVLQGEGREEGRVHGRLQRQFSGG